MSVVYRDLKIDCTKDNMLCEQVTMYEHGVTTFRFKCVNQGVPINLSDCKGAVYYGIKSDGHKIGNACTVDSDRILLPLSLQMTTAEGYLKGTLELQFDSGNLRFHGVNFDVAPAPKEADIKSTDEFTALETIIAEAKKIIEEGIETSQGKSAYEIAVENGFEGTETEWLASLKGSDGAKGDKGDTGEKGSDGKNGIDGKDGLNGEDGIGITSAEVNSNGELILTYSDGTSANAGVVKGEQGEKGDIGAAGANGTDYVLTDEDKTEIASLVSIPTKISELENDLGFIDKIKTLNGQSMLGDGNIEISGTSENFKFIGEVETTEEVNEIVFEHSLAKMSIIEVMFFIPATNDSVKGTLSIDGQNIFSGANLYVNGSNPVYGVVTMTKYKKIPTKLSGLSYYSYYCPLKVEGALVRYGSDVVTIHTSLNINPTGNDIKLIATGDIGFPVGTKLCATEINLAKE